MAPRLLVAATALACAAALISTAFAQAPSSVSLPAGVRADWDLADAYHQTTPTCQRICINGLWQWQPARSAFSQPPAGEWGYFKAPGCWPGITDYLQKDCQTLFESPAWENTNLASVTAAWYQRQISIPAGWSGRRIAISARYLNSYAVVFVDGQKAGEMRFPAGEVDVSRLCQPGHTYRLSLLVVALPLKAVLLSATNVGQALRDQGSVARRGLCGDVYLSSTPTGARLDDLKIQTSVRHWEITFSPGLQDLAPNARYTLRAQVLDGNKVVREVVSQPFTAGDLSDGYMSFTAKWKPAKLWDTDTPGNLYQASVTLLSATGKVLDQGFPTRFGFREFWIQGRDFYLNGTRIYLSVAPIDNAQIGAAWATYQSARETMERDKSFGINFVYTHNYDCEPGSHLSFDDILRAADDVGMLVALSQPHFNDYDWKAPDADKTNGYAGHARFYVHVAGNHPSVVAYAMSHNATGYNGDENPDNIDGLSDSRDRWSRNGATLALKAQAIVKHLDPTRIVYHHDSGNLGAMYTLNFYPNFTPIQELSDWFAHWATRGVKPLFLCEYGAPFTWDWTMYRGWYKGKREWGSASVPWEFCLAEWDAQFLGPRAFNLTPMEKANLRWEARQFQAGRTWHRWDYPYDVGSNVFDDRQTVLAMYIKDNWRAYRTWGVSGISPWEYGEYWRLKPGVNRGRKALQAPWNDIQRPGYSPDYLNSRYEQVNTAYTPADWIPTAPALALLRNNMPLLAYIAGPPGDFTSKGHNFTAGQTVSKQIILINDSRRPVTCHGSWSSGLPGSHSRSIAAQAPAGGQVRQPISFSIPASTRYGSCTISATFRFSTGDVQKDSFTIDVLPRPQPLSQLSPVALFDPHGETAAMLRKMGVRFHAVNAGSALSSHDLLVIGKDAIPLTGPCPALDQVPNGLRVVVFEQKSDVLEKRLGFRVEKYGLRRVFECVPNSPMLAGLTNQLLQNWQGSATLLAPRGSYYMNPQFSGAPTIKWCGMDVTRLWRCGRRGNVASVLIEIPARGDFLPVVDGGFCLQYSPLLEYHEGKGLVVFCQMDVTGRSESDPAAAMLVHNILKYASSWRPGPARSPIYAGDAAGRTYLASDGISAADYTGAPLSGSQVLIVGPGAHDLTGSAASIRNWLKGGGHMLGIGLGQEEASALLPFVVTMKKAEYFGAAFAPPAATSPLAGVGPGDLHNRDPRTLPLISSGMPAVSNGALGCSPGRNVVLSQLAPWQFSPTGTMNIKRTFRRVAFATSRLLANLGVPESTPLLGRFGSPPAPTDQRWLDGLYLDRPQEWDDPYRTFGW